jgi:hypothetical protein
MALLLLVASPVFGATIEGVEFADQIVARDTPMVIHGVGLLRWKVLFRGFVAALYRGEGVPPEKVLGQVPRRLEIEYFWGISGSAFGKTGEEILARNVPPETIAALRPRLDRINALYPDVKPGDRLALTYVPGNGTELSHNGKALGVIEGDDFAAVYYLIWLGTEPMDKSLRDQLLGRTKP